MSNRWCKRGADFSNLAQAQAACLRLGSRCHGVHDRHCDGRASYLCTDIVGPLPTPHSAGCVYQPSTVSATTFRPTTGSELRGAARTYWHCAGVRITEASVRLGLCDRAAQRGRSYRSESCLLSSTKKKYSHTYIYIFTEMHRHLRWYRPQNPGLSQ